MSARVRLNGPMTIERLAQSALVLAEARWGDQDPTRRQLAERGQRAGVAITPRIEVQHAEAALELTTSGLADTLVTRAPTRSDTAIGSSPCRSTRRSTRRSPSSNGATRGSHRPPARS